MYNCIYEYVEVNMLMRKHFKSHIYEYALQKRRMHTITVTTTTNIYKTKTFTSGPFSKGYLRLQSDQVFSDDVDVGAAACNASFTVLSG